MQDNKISDAVIRRLPKYYRYLSELEAAGVERISSSRMSKEMNLNASQIRRDLNCFGGFGQQGYGYQVLRLKQEIMKILGIGNAYKVIVVGAGNIGQALLKYKNFTNEGYNIVAVFDADEKMIGKNINGITVRPMSALPEFFAVNMIDIGIIAVPKPYAQKTADELVVLGVRAIWNFAPLDVEVRRGISVENVHLSDSLYVLSYHMRENDENH
ncbi:MAG: redox-sensing transcriptional repressor Rex [Eubacteriales bacterium]|nr:redox-sensing transcriptional repressor Rex [Eubacteriales bacterium]